MVFANLALRIESLYNSLSPILSVVFTFVIIFGIAGIITYFTNNAIWNAYKKQRKKGRLIRVDEIKVQIIQKIIKYSLFIIAVIILLLRFDIRPGSLLAGAGFAGIVIGFAAQSALSNVISGLLLTFDRPFKLGDRVDIAGVYGDLMDIGLRSVRIKTPENLLVTIANNDVASSQIINYTESKYYKTRLLIPISVSYESNLPKVRKILLRVAKKNQDILDKPESEVITKGFGEYAINVELWVWTNRARGKRKVISDLLNEVREQFEKNNIEIPYPKRISLDTPSKSKNSKK